MFACLLVCSIFLPPAFPFCCLNSAIDLLKDLIINKGGEEKLFWKVAKDQGLRLLLMVSTMESVTD